MKKKGAHTGREKGRGGVETHEQGHEHSGAEGHKKVLHAGQCLACGTESDGEEDMNEGTNFIFPLQK